MFWCTICNRGLEEMVRIISSGALLFVLFAVGYPLAANPSFDCTKASSQVESVICRSDRLARQDLKLSRLYENVLAGLPEDVRKEIREEQLNWLKRREKVCPLYDVDVNACLLPLYGKRNSELSAMLAFESSDNPGDDELKVLRITPKGNDVLAARQLVFQFDRPVVPIGAMERNSEDVPVTISPVLKCEWRWLNTSALACQLRDEDKMKQATRYKVVMERGIKTESGIQLKEIVSHTFTTTRPRVTYTRFVNWLSPGTPLLQVTFNQPVTRTSVERSLTMLARRGGDIESVQLEAYPDDRPRGGPGWMAGSGQEKGRRVDDRPGRVAGEEARRVWLVKPHKELLLNETILLRVNPGLKSSEGEEAGIETRTVVSFETYPEFEFIGLRCTLKGELRRIEITLEKLEKPREDQFLLKPCAPLRPVALIFSSPVMNAMVKDHVGFSPHLDGGRKDYDPWENTHDWSRLSSPHRAGRTYQIWLPERLRAHQKYTVHIDIENLKDEFGRHLKNKVGFDFFTGHREPRLVISHRYAVLEKGVDSDVPLTVTNLDNVTITYDKVGDTHTDTGVTKELTVGEAEDISYAIPMGVRELLGDESGILYAGLHPDPTPPRWTVDSKVLAQVTPFQVHFKVGHFNSQAWVTTFDKAKPVKGAKVSLYKGSYDDLPGLIDLEIAAVTDKNGLAELPGLSEFDPDLAFIYGGYRWDRPGFFARIEHAGNIAVLPLNRHFSIRGSGGGYPWLQKKGGHTHAWGTTAQGIYKLGDTVQFKIYVREQSNRHWVSPGKDGYELKVFDPQNKVVFEQRGVVLNEFGSFDGEFKVPEQGAVGWYNFKLSSSKEPGQKPHRSTWTPMSVLVSDFTPSPFKVTTELNGTLFKAMDRIEVTSLATLHSGGAFTGAEIRLTAKLTDKPFTTNNPIAAGFTFGSSSGKYLNQKQKNLLDIRGKLDDVGQHKDVFTLPETEIYFGSIVVESAVKDERGKFVASSSRADYAGRNRFVGLRNTNWLYQKGETAKLNALVVDQSGKLVSGVDIVIEISRREYKAARVKGPGNAYLTKNIMEWVQESTCRMKSVKAASHCKFKPEHPGYYQFVATIKDELERDHKTTLHGWVTGRGSVVWDQTNDATLQIIAEQTKVNIGDTARYLIKNPFPGAKALVTIERYGVLDSWIETLKTSTPVIEVPIKADYLPGFYLSVVVTSPRVARPLGPGKVDLGKPGYRMGYVRVKVTDPYKEIGIVVSTNKDVYKPREKVQAEIQISAKNISDGEAIEIAVAVVDESVLALNRSGDNYYDPYAGFNRLDSLDVTNYSLISRLVGRQKFEKKGANPGGGGSAFAELRNRFKFVSYWNPSIQPDDSGNASFEFEVPDNLTGWRIFAFAVTKDDRMGLGDASFKVNRPTEIRPVMPNQVLEGDEFDAGFNVMNRTDKSRTLEVKVAVDGPLVEGAKKTFSYDLTVPPYGRMNVWLPLVTKGSGDLKFSVEAYDLLDGDAIAHKIPVNKRRSLETASTYGTFISNKVSEAIKIPEGIHTDVGSISAVLSPSVIGNLDGAFEYVKAYPYQCWEQRLTKAVVANSYIELEEYLDEETLWQEPEEDIAKALLSAANFQAANGGMVYWLPSNRNVSPYLSAYTAIAFNWLRKSGYAVPEQVEERLHAYLLNLLRRDDFPTFYNKGLASTVRAVALAALAESGKISDDDVARYESHLPEMDLFGKAHFLQAAIKTRDVSKETISKTIDSILGYASQTGGKFQFNEPWDDSYKYILATPLRSNCSVLSSLISAQVESDQAVAVADILFKLAGSITRGRGNRDHWENTQENVFCLNALVDYASMYEKDDPSFSVVVSFDGEKLGEASFSSRSDAMVTIGRPIADDDPGRAATIDIEKEGTGRLYYSARIAYDLKEDNATRINSGIEIRREYSVERDNKFSILHSPMDIKRGDLVRVDLFVSVPTARHFVVVNDPIPGGLEPVNTNLATASRVDGDKGAFKAAAGSWFYQFSDWFYYGRYFWSFYHKELRHDSAKFYADYLPAGNYHLSYTAQAIATGKFTVMPVRAEEMYDPDVYGKGLSAILKVVD